jgi:hypothetical protein
LETWGDWIDYRYYTPLGLLHYNSYLLFFLRIKKEGESNCKNYKFYSLQGLLNDVNDPLSLPAGKGRYFSRFLPFLDFKQNGFLPLQKIKPF